MSTPDALAIALKQHRAKNAIVIGWVRVVGAVLWFISNTVVATFSHREELPLTLPFIGGWFVLGVIALVVLKLKPDVRERAHTLHWLVDMPAIFAVQWVAVKHAQNATAVAYLTATIFAALLVAGQLGARPIDAIAEAVVSITLFVILVLNAHDAHPSYAIGPAMTLVLIAVIGRVGTRQMLGSLEEVTRTEAMRERLSRYLSPSVREAVMAGGLSSSSTRREVTVLMSDLRGFTSLAEKMDSEKLARELNEYFKEMVEVVFRHQGTLDKFIGDGMLVYFGAPLPNEQHAQSAVACALEMQKALEHLNTRREARGDPPLRMGIGINCGAVVVGDLGPPERVEYTIIGDTVNVTARMESLTKKFGVKVLASQEVQRRAAAGAKFAPMAPAEVSGKSEPLLTWAVEPV